jgi:hypothetical protein
MDNVLWEEDVNYTTPISPQNFIAAVDLLETQMLLRNQHTLLGAYALVYLHCLHQPNKQPLLKALGEVIGLDWKQSEVLNNEALDFALEMLDDFATLPNIHAVLDLTGWGGTNPMQHFKNNLALERGNVLQRIRDEQKSQEEMVQGFVVVSGGH